MDALIAGLGDTVASLAPYHYVTVSAGQEYFVNSPVLVT